MQNLEELKSIACNFRVLYVEDDIAIANTLINYLSKFFKEVIYAKNGEDGLELYGQDNYDIVITDINMPKMNGLEMSEKIKEINPHQNIIVISAYSEVDNFLTSIKLGIDGYIIKPVDYTDMNNILYKIVVNLKAFKENIENEEKLEALVKKIAKKNGELKQYTDVIDKVAIVSKTDLKGNITYINDFFCNVSGYTKEELLGKSHHMIRHKDMSKSVYQELWQTIQSGEIWEGTIKNKAKDSTPYYVHVLITPVFKADGKTIREYVGIGFLTTTEEIEKREFKKKVMTNHLEFKKTYTNSVERIASLEKELEILKNSDQSHQHETDGFKVKYKRALSQVDYYEKQIKDVEQRYEKVLKLSKENITKVTDSHKQALSRIEKQQKKITFLNHDQELKKNEVLKLTQELNEQQKIIKDLRETLKTIGENKKGSKEENNYSLFNPFI